MAGARLLPNHLSLEAFLWWSYCFGLIELGASMAAHRLRGFFLNTCLAAALIILPWSNARRGS